MKVLVKYTRKLGPRGSGGDWSTDGATTHAAYRFGGTLCGRGKPDAPARGASERGWEALERPEYEVTCQHCIRALRRR